MGREELFYSKSPGSQRATRLNGIKIGRKSKIYEETKSLRVKWRYHGLWASP